MPFFQQPTLYPETALLSLLSELSDLPQTKTSSSCQPRRKQQQEHQPPTPTFTPKFDVTEVENSYELFGELPGIEQEAISIEFSDAQTILITGGKTVRPNSSSSSSPSSSTPTLAPSQEPDSSKDKDIEETSSVKSSSAHSATVEDDDYDEVDTPLSSTPATPPVTSAAEVKVVVTPPQAQQAQAHQAQQAEPKYWISERQVGTFERSFSFAQRIDHDGVQASLKNGILHIVVPKMQQGKGRKVVVNVL